MALNVTELEIVRDLAARYETPDILSLGYPDLLAARENITELFGVTTFPSEAFRADGAEVAKVHGQPRLEAGVFSPEYVVGLMGGRFHFADLFPGEGIALNLNAPIPESLTNSFDIVVDPGTLEHVFNIAQGFANVARLLRVGGACLLQHPMVFPNHGHYSVSPTAYHDFFTNNGFEVERIFTYGAPTNGDNFCPSTTTVEPRPVMVTESCPIIIGCVARKVLDLEIAWPLQWNYSEMLFTDWFRALQSGDDAKISQFAATWLQREPHRAAEFVHERFPEMAQDALADMPKRRHYLGMTPSPRADGRLRSIFANVMPGRHDR